MGFAREHILKRQGRVVSRCLLRCGMQLKGGHGVHLGSWILGLVALGRKQDLSVGFYVVVHFLFFRIVK